MLQKLKILLASLLLVGLTGASEAAAAPTKPSTAAQLGVGVPYSSTIDRSKAATEWLKPPQYMRPGDTLTIASDSSNSSIRYCLVPLVDDFAQADTEEACDGPGYTSAYQHVDVDQGKFRRTLEWTEPPGYGLLLVAPGCGFCGEDIWVYSLTVEQVVTRVNIGAPTLARSPRNVSLTATAAFGDNTAASDGIPGRLLWREGESGELRPIAEATTTGGRLAFNGTLPQEAAGRTIQLSACVDQVGGGEPRCTVQNVAIDPDPKPTLALKRLKVSRSRTIKVPLTCAAVLAPGGCRGSIELKTRRTVRYRGANRKVRLALGTFSIPAGQTTTVKLRLSKKLAKLVSKQARARAAEATVRLTGQPGKRVSKIRLLPG